MIEQVRELLTVVQEDLKAVDDLLAGDGADEISVIDLARLIQELGPICETASTIFKDAAQGK